MLKGKILLFTIYYSLSTILTGCTTIYNPATEKKEVIFINTASEVAIGKNVEKEVFKKYRVLEDKPRQDYVNRIGQDIASVSDRKDLEYQFTVLDSKEINAFALPGGRVYICSGLLKELNEDEIACVLGHEVGHIAARHSVKRLQGQLGYQLLMTIALYEVSKKDRDLAQTVARGAGSVFGLVLLGYSRQDELLADRLGVKYAHRAGYNPRGMLTTLEKLEQLNKESGSPKVLAIFRSHPGTSDRIKALQTELATLEDEQKKNSE